MNGTSTMLCSPGEVPEVRPSRKAAPRMRNPTTNPTLMSANQNSSSPSVAPWVFALIAMVAFTASNLVHVGNFGELEFWFALIKVGFVVGFLILGAAFLLGLTSGTSPGLHNIVGVPFMPKGVSGVAGALLVVIFAFGGIELMAVAAAETADPQRSVAKAVRTICGASCCSTWGR